MEKLLGDMVFESNSAMSGETSSRPVTREAVLELMRQRDEIDETIQALGQILKSVFL